jgi:Tol biopolymer transport system component
MLRVHRQFIVLRYTASHTASGKRRRAETLYRVARKSADLLRMSLVTTAATLAICVLALVETANTAEAKDSLPQNGKIAFSSNRSGNGDVYAAEPDDSDLSRLTDSRYVEGFPAWSPSGTEIAFSRQYLDDSAISIMSADGSNLRDLDTNWTWGLDFAWSSDGKKLAFSRTGGPPNYTSDIYVMDLDGSNKIALTKTPRYSEQFPDFSPDDSQMCLSVTGGPWKLPLGIYVTDADGSDPTLLFEDDTGQGECDWSPAGGKVAFYAIEGGDTQKAMEKQKKAMEKAAAEENFQKKMEKVKKASAYSDKEVYVINADGSGLTALTSNSADDVNPRWSPDGTKIAFASNRDGDFDIYTMDADGSDVVQVTNWPNDEGTPDWQPLPGPTPPKDADGSDGDQGTKKPGVDDVDRDRPERTVIVKPGDSLWSISEQRLGPEASPQRVYDHTYQMYALNRKRIGADPNLIFAGQRLSLPPPRYVTH